MKKLSSEQMNFFQSEGYLMVPDVFDRDDLTPLRDELTGVIDAKARQLVREGKLSRPYDEEPFESRLTRVWNECPEIMQPLTGKGGGGYSGVELFRVITHRKLLAYIEGFVGPEIVGSSVYRIRPKVPFMDSGVVPWHQDSGYFEQHCDSDLIVTVWMPLVDATPENGCLQVLPCAHEGGVYRHWTNGPNGYLAIADEDLPPTGQPVTVPVPLGGVLFMGNCTPHCSTPNTSDVVRWSLDLRYQNAGVPNNVGEMPEDFTRERPTHEIACYPPEADFVVQSPSAPERTVCDPVLFDQIRQRYEHTRPQGPQRGWGNYAERNA